MLPRFHVAPRDCCPAVEQLLRVVEQLLRAVGHVADWELLLLFTQEVWRREPEEAWRSQKGHFWLASGSEHCTFDPLVGWTPTWALNSSEACGFSGFGPEVTRTTAAAHRAAAPAAP